MIALLLSDDVMPKFKTLLLIGHNQIRAWGNWYAWSPDPLSLEIAEGCGCETTIKLDLDQPKNPLPS